MISKWLFNKKGVRLPARLERVSASLMNGLCQRAAELLNCAAPGLIKPGRCPSVRVSATVYTGALVAQPSSKFAVVVSRFNSLVTKQLLEGAQETFTRHGVDTSSVDVSALLQ